MSPMKHLDLRDLLALRKAHEDRLRTPAGRAQVADELQAFVLRLHRVTVLPKAWELALATLRNPGNS